MPRKKYSSKKKQVTQKLLEPSTILEEAEEK